MSSMARKLNIADLLDNMLMHIDLGHTVWLQWECVGCHEKITADEPVSTVLRNGETCIALHKSYLHTTKDNGELCGVSTPLTAQAFNFMLAITLG